MGHGVKYWSTSRRQIALERPLVMAILNVTPDSFSDGGKFADGEAALRQAEKMIGEGADIIDVGGESTRPGSERVQAEVEIARVVPVIEAVAKRFDIPISIDTSRSETAKAALNAGAEIINDISGLRFDARIAEAAAATGAGLVLMHSRGDFETMHSQPPVDDIMAEVCAGLRNSLDLAAEAGVERDRIVLDPGIGFGKTSEQNLELLAKLDRLIAAFPDMPVLVGTSRKSFIGKLLGDRPVEGRLAGSIATAAAAVMKGARIIRAHDVRETADAVRVAIAATGTK
jgi:dihydropteroate synthase